MVRTDHNSLVWLTNFKNLQGQLARWLEELRQYSMQICHRRGKDHVDADILTRIRDDVPYCDCYRTVKDITLLPCKGCKYCERAHLQWADFKENVLEPHMRKERQAEDYDVGVLKK